MCRLRKRQLYKYCSEVIIPPNVISANLWKVPSVQDVITCYSGPVHIKVGTADLDHMLCCAVLCCSVLCCAVLKVQCIALGIY